MTASDAQLDRLSESLRFLGERLKSPAKPWGAFHSPQWCVAALQDPNRCLRFTVDELEHLRLRLWAVALWGET